jgi:hypothetical protein
VDWHVAKPVSGTHRTVNAPCDSARIPADRGRNERACSECWDLHPTLFSYVTSSLLVRIATPRSVQYHLFLFPLQCSNFDRWSTFSSAILCFFSDLAYFVNVNRAWITLPKTAFPYLQVFHTPSDHLPFDKQPILFVFLIDVVKYSLLEAGIHQGEAYGTRGNVPARQT